LTSTSSDARLTLAVTTLAAFLTPFTASAANIALPSIGRGLHLDAVTLSWVATTYLLAIAAFLVPMGRLADLRGRRRMFVTGMGIYALTSLACGLAPSAGVLIAARIVQGMGGAMMFGTGVAVLSAAFPPERRGWVLGVNVTGVYVGLSVGPFAGGLLTDHLGWRSVFVVNAVLAALATVATLRWLRGEPAAGRAGRLDVVGSILYAAGLVSFMLGLARLPRPGAFGGLALGVLLLALFVRRQLRSPAPVLDMSLFRRNRVFALSNAAALINYAATFAVGFLLSLYLQEARGLGPEASGLILVAQPVMMALLSPVAGRLSDRVEPRLVASAGMVLTVIGLGMLAAVGRETPLAYVVACLVVLGCGFGLFSSPNTNAVMGAVAQPDYGVASSILATARSGGQMLSMGLATLLLSLYVGPARFHDAGHDALVSGMRVGFAVFAGLCVLGTLASMVRGRSGPGPGA
jgi:EmrB/QacA subfamily drug resistance transporter